jgi:ATP-dependent RNA helicase DDX55/SPB4
VCVEATTGSGKTLAFGLPIFEIIRRCVGDNIPNKHDTYALIMAPTRELASQIYEVIAKIAKQHSNYKIMLMVGGTHVNECCTAYENDGAQIIIGTPGRILDVKNRIPTVLTFKKLEVIVACRSFTVAASVFTATDPLPRSC